jgi:hypothetical protein
MLAAAANESRDPDVGMLGEQPHHFAARIARGADDRHVDERPAAA